MGAWPEHRASVCVLMLASVQALAPPHHPLYHHRTPRLRTIRYVAQSTPPRGYRSVAMRDSPFDFDARLLAADSTLIFAFALTRTLNTIVLSPTFEGWLAPIAYDTQRLVNTFAFASTWLCLWILGGQLFNCFSPDVDDRSATAVGPTGAAKAFTLAFVIWIALAAARGALNASFAPLDFAPPPELVPGPFVLAAYNVQGSIAVGLLLIAWRSVVGGMSLR